MTKAEQGWIHLLLIVFIYLLDFISEYAPCVHIINFQVCFQMLNIDYD